MLNYFWKNIAISIFYFIFLNYKLLNFVIIVFFYFNLLISDIAQVMFLMIIFLYLIFINKIKLISFSLQ